MLARVHYVDAAHTMADPIRRGHLHYMPNTPVLEDTNSMRTLVIAVIVVLIAAVLLSSGAEVEPETVISVSKYADRRGWIILE